MARQTSPQSSSNSTPVSNKSASHYTWKTGFTDFVALVKEYPLFTITFLIFHCCIAFTLIQTFLIRNTEILSKCEQLKNKPGMYFNGSHFVKCPEFQGDLTEEIEKLSAHTRKHLPYFLEDLESYLNSTNSPLSLEQAEAVLQQNGEFIVHKYRAIVSCHDSSPNKALLYIALTYIVGFAGYLIYLVSPYGRQD